MSAQDAAPVPPGPDPVTTATGTEEFSWTRPSPCCAIAKKRYAVPGKD